MLEDSVGSCKHCKSFGGSLGRVEGFSDELVGSVVLFGVKLSFCESSALLFV